MIQKTDEELVALAIQDKEKYVYLVQKYEQKMLSFLRKLTRLPEQEYEDILQNSFIKLYLNLNNYDRSLSFQSWLYRIVHNEFIDFWRKHKNIRATVSLDQQGEEEVPLYDIIADDQDIPRDTDRKILEEKVRDVLLSLPIEYREVIVLKYLEDKDYEEMSDILKKPSGTIATLLHRAKKLLKDKLTILLPQETNHA